MINSISFSGFSMRSIIRVILIGFVYSCVQPGKDRSHEVINLVPKDAGPSPGYFCTWGAQNYLVDNSGVSNSLNLREHAVPAENLNQQNILGSGDCRIFEFDQVRKDLFIVFDVGWGVPTGLNFDTARYLSGSMIDSNKKFPLLKNRLANLLRTLNELIKKSGWKEAGIRVPGQASGNRENHDSMDQLKQFFRDRILWSRETGIDYWQIGNRSKGSVPGFRRMLSDKARGNHPGLWEEHSMGGGPLNDEACPWHTDNFHHQGSLIIWDDGNKVKKAIEEIEFSEIFRTYDVTTRLSIPTPLHRVAQILNAIERLPESKGLINCEDEPLLGAVLGYVFGIMRYPDKPVVEGSGYDSFNVKNNFDHIIINQKQTKIYYEDFI